MKNDPTYTCAECGELFVKAASDEEVDAELKRLFGFLPNPEGMKIFCPKCAKELHGEDEEL